MVANLRVFLVSFIRRWEATIFFVVPFSILVFRHLSQVEVRSDTDNEELGREEFSKSKDDQINGLVKTTNISQNVEYLVGIPFTLRLEGVQLQDHFEQNLVLDNALFVFVEIRLCIHIGANIFHLFVALILAVIYGLEIAQLWSFLGKGFQLSLAYSRLICLSIIIRSGVLFENLYSLDIEISEEVHLLHVMRL